jgi:hypothetical protein
VTRTARLLLRPAGWAGVTALVALAARTLAYALAPAPTALADRLEHEAGGPRLVVLAAAVPALAGLVSAALVWLVAMGVEERARAEAAAAPPRASVRRIVLRALALWCASAALFTAVESTLHARAGLGHHGIACLLGPVHRNAVPILLGLSLLAAALVAAAGQLLAWARRVAAALTAGTAGWPRLASAPTGAPPVSEPRPAPRAGGAGPRGPPRLPVSVHTF